MSKFSLKTDNGIIEYKPFSLSDYIKYNFARSSDNSDAIKGWSKDILKSHTNAVDVPKHIAELVLINLLANSLNQEKCVQEYVCECGNEFDVALDTSKAYINYGTSDIEELYSFDKFKIKLNWPKIFDDDNVPLMIVNCIDSIYVGDERIKMDELTSYELDDLYSTIMPEDMDAIKKILLEPKVQLAVPVKCPKCGKAHVHVLTGFKEFIRIIQ